MVSGTSFLLFYLENGMNCCIHICLWRYRSSKLSLLQRFFWCLFILLAFWTLPPHPFHIWHISVFKSC